MGVSNGAVQHVDGAGVHVRWLERVEGGPSRRDRWRRFQYVAKGGGWSRKPMLPSAMERPGWAKMAPAAVMRASEM